MLQLELQAVAQRIVTDLAEVSAGEETLVLTDGRNGPVAMALASAARAIGAEASLLVMPATEAHGNEPPALAATALETADVALTATTHSITHTRARLAAAEAGTRIVILRGVDEGLMLDGGINTDYEWLAKTTTAVRDRLSAALEATVTSPAGTDVWMDLTDQPAFALDGFFHDYGFSALPPGESPTAPAEGSAQGTVVVDYSMDGLGVLDEPIHLEFQEGYVQTIEGGSAAAELEALVAAHPNAGNMAEFAIGTNPDATLVGNLAEDKKKLGTVHFAIGDNESLGGTTQCDIHLDGVVLEPTVTLDGETIISAGEIALDAIEGAPAAPR
jgi:leucyl aminopeptidase (aminopeptidase T)